MPWLIRQQGNQYCVFAEGADGNPAGESRGCHATREEAEAQRRALYANVVEKATRQTSGVAEEKEASTFSLWKEASGQYRWFSVYSNNYRDDDNPSEIISERSHLTYLDMVRKGVIDYPELWLWHVPIVWGKADALEYINGFAVATGYVYPGYEGVAENLAKQKNLATSHGMPRDLIVRDEHDPSVINFHITREISPLPAHRAANRRTGFALLKGEGDMPLSKEKQDWIKANLPKEKQEEAERYLLSLEKEATESGVESKEATEAAAAEAEQPEAEAEAPAAETQEEPQAEAEAVKEKSYVTAEEVAQVLTETLTPIIEGQRALTDTLTSLTKEISDLKQADAEKVKSLREETPALSLKELVAKNLIGNPAAKVDEADDLHQHKPKEREAQPVAGPTLVPFVNGLIQHSAQGR